MLDVCVNSNKKDILHSSATPYIPYESSISQLPGDMFGVHLRLGNNLWGQHDCHSTGIFARCIAGMTSHIRPLCLISRRD